MGKKQSLGQFYTTNSKYIIGDLLDHIPANSTIIDPFAGNHDLLNLFSNSFNKLAYDIDPKLSETIKKDTILDPPNYNNKWIITNPPYLAKNKNKDKTIYNKYKVNDLYKAFIKSTINNNCDGGIYIIPLNFFSDEDSNIRLDFFSQYKIIKLKIFEEQIFDDTTYTICAFSFIKSTRQNNYNINIIFLPSNENKILTINKDSGFRVGGEFYDLINSINSNIKISRLIKNSNQIPNTNLLLRSVDTGSNDGRISLSISDHFYGLSTDRVFATILTSKFISTNGQNFIATEFNRLLEEYREKYNSLFLTNFRNSTKQYSRKRIAFDVAYKLIQYVIENNKEVIF